MLENMPTLHFSIADINISLSSKQSFLKYYIHKKFIDFINVKNNYSNSYKVYVFPYENNNIGIDDLFQNMPDKYRSIDAYGIKGYIDDESKTYYLHAPKDPNIAETVMRITTSDIIINEFGIMLHSSGVIDNNMAILFSGKSGAGKSTMAELSLPRVILNDEMIALRIVSGGLVCYSTPFSGSGRSSYLNTGARVKRLYFIEQSKENVIANCGKEELITRFWCNVFSLRKDSAASYVARSVIAVLADANSCKILRFRKDRSVWESIEKDVNCTL